MAYNEKDKYSPDSRDARARSYQYGGYVDYSPMQSAQTGGGSTTIQTGEGSRTISDTASSEDMKRAIEEGAEGERRWEHTKGGLGKELNKLLGQGGGYKKGIFGSEGVLGQKGGFRDFGNATRSLGLDKNLGFSKGGVFSNFGESVKDRLAEPLEKGVRGLGRSLKKLFRSDIHMKENIDFVGKSGNDINIYEWNYVNDPKKDRYKGVIAQQLTKENSDAVIKDDKGLAVDYDKIDVDFEKVKK